MRHGLLVNHEQDILVSHFPRGPIRVRGATIRDGGPRGREDDVGRGVG